MSHSIWPTCRGLLRSRCWVCSCLVLGIIGTAYLGLQFGAVYFQLYGQTDSTWHTLGWSGHTPSTRYLSFDESVPTIDFLRQDSRCSQENILLSPRGPSVDGLGGIILDAAGDLVWWQTVTKGQTQDLRVQEYYGEKYLTYWAEEEHGGYKRGSWFMMNSNYTVQYRIRPGGQYRDGEISYFDITAENTALITTYRSIDADLSSVGGPSKGYLLDNIFQEVVISTGQVLFQWSAAANFPVNATSGTLNHCTLDLDSQFKRCGQDSYSAFDFYHMNSVEKDHYGNYLVSGRNANTVSYVDGETGKIIWNLGGRNNEFKNIADRAAVKLSQQNSVQWYEQGQSIYLFDNGFSVDFDGTESRGRIISLDVEHRTVEFLTPYYHPQRKTPPQQGDMQLLKDGENMFIGWGQSSAITEFSLDGEILCDAYIRAALTFPFGSGTSYRASRHSWVGRPTTLPSAVVVDGSVYVSWNGATEVVTWQLEAVDEEDQPREALDYNIISRSFKEGFETAIKIPGGEMYSGIRVVALDTEDRVMGVSDVLGYETTATEWNTSRKPVMATGAFLGVFIALNLAVVLHGRLRRKQGGEYGISKGGFE
ncbi:Fc.00g027230.m01.CDS01 [Cosmosporella sp. VM-42]